MRSLKRLAPPSHQSTMVGNIHQHPTPAVPCALKHCLPHEYDAQTLAALSEHDRRVGFQNWVKYSRIASSARSSEILAQENLLCPLLWCRTSFEDLPSNLRHISSCSWLSDAWYWCPSCCHSERFMVCASTSPSDSRQDGPEEEILIRRAVAFFRNFGCNDDSAHSPGLSRVNTPDSDPLIPAYTRRSFDEHHLHVGRTQDVGHNAFEPSRNEGRSKSHAYIADLCDVLRTFGEEWIRRLALGTNVPQVLPEQYFHCLFQRGIRALRNYFRGMTPNSFQDVFALMHVSMASSYIVRKDHHAYSWNTFLEEACQWQHLFSNEIEKGAFIKAMSRLCHPQEYTTSSSFKEFTIENHFLPAEQATLVRLIDSLFGDRVDVVIEENSQDDREHSTAEKEQSRLPRLLQSNAILKGCMEFLDDFGHAIVVEDLASRQIKSSKYITEHVPGIETLDSNIVRRLQEWKGLEAFRGGITETQRMLRCGLLYSARDVEIMLVWFGKSCSKSPRLLRRYLAVVKDLCDTVMKDLGPHWRNPFYDVILGTVLATSAERSRYEGHATKIPSATPLDNFDLSYNASTSTGLTSAPTPPVVHASTVSSPNLVPTPSAPSDDVSHCPDSSCKASFTGSSRKTNLKRHLRTALHHNKDAQFKCKVCQATFGRTDNLQQHVRNIHGLDPGLKSQK